MGYNIKQNADGSTSLQNHETATEVLKLDAEDNVHLNAGALTAGEGITAGTGTVFDSAVNHDGGIYKTTILIDLTGLNSDATLGDIIGVDATSDGCYLGQFTASRNGAGFAGLMTCLEAPAGGEVDIDLYSADEATGVTDGAISGLTNGVQLVSAGADWTAGAQVAFAGLPVADQYLYLTVGTSSTPTAGTYTAGKFLIEIYGN